MNYIEYTFTVTPSVPGLEIAEAALSELPFESFTIEDGVLKAYIQEELFCEEDFNDMFLWDLPDMEISYEKKIIPQQDWNAVWESNFTPIDVDGKAMVRAPFHAAPTNGIDIIIEPRMSFGTGHHQTTYMMMQHLLAMDIRDLDVCDMGCGTAVLAILAKKLGASHVVGIDIDQWAYDNAMDNITANDTPDITVKLGGAEALGDEKFDILLANINRNILLRYMQAYCAAIREGGHLLLSGFYVPDAPVLIEEAARYGFILENSIEKDHWTALHLRKKE
ncbi:MAG: 50S ribosomal protein L11 methyltransferase [Flavobacteriales bacterium]|nr:50S ribosomal protein L11 methyltransferase [Flavobacteriales bacterium]